MSKVKSNPGTGNWLGDLQQAGIGGSYDESLAALLRAIASLEENAVCLSSGPAALPYVNSLRDGLSMNGRLIVHLSPEQQSLRAVVQQQLDADIRVAGHFQESMSFCSDIAVHRMDLMLVDAASNELAAADQWVALLRKNAMLIFLGDEQTRPHIEARYAADFFVAAAGAKGHAVILTPKGLQHRQVRSGRRRGTR